MAGETLSASEHTAAHGDGDRMPGVIDIEAVLNDPALSDADRLAALRAEEARLRAIAEDDEITLGSGEAARLEEVLAAIRKLDDEA